MIKIIYIYAFFVYLIPTYSQKLDDSSRIDLESRMLQLENKIDKSGFYLNEASKDLNRMFWYSFLGTATTVTLGLLTTKENEKISIAVFIPFTIGGIVGIVNYFFYKDDIKEAGKILQKIKK